jgi:LmbE family N-acetylglucosaminyl deacetylase
MATLVCFHAHPDDECMTTGGTIARAAADGHRVVLVVATGGEWGETPDDLGAGETLAQRRASEVAASAVALGIARVEFLGYQDSGMTGWEQNANPGSFMNAPVDEAAARLASILTEENATTLTTYDWHGGYGHPDHIAVHHVGKRAAEIANTPFVYEATMNRDAMLRFFDSLKAAGIDPGWDPESGTDDGNPVGTSESELTTAIDVTGFVSHKKASMAAHRSQISDTSFFHQLPEEVYANAFGTEWFRRISPRDVETPPNGSAGPMETWLGGLQ